MAAVAIEAKHVLDVVETAYGAYANADDWYVAVTSALNRALPCAAGFSAIPYEWGYVEGAFRTLDIGPPAALAGDARWTERIRQQILAIPSDLAERLHGRMQANTLSHASGLGHSVLEHPVLDEVFVDGPHEQLAIVVPEPDGRGVIFANSLAAPTTIPLRAQVVLDRMTFHIAAGQRVHEREVDAADAVFSETGRILHADPKLGAEHVALAAGFERRAEARRHARDPETALRIWRGLAAGRWSIVDHWDTDGKRFALAVRNPPRTRGFALLSSRERRVAALAAAGNRDKEIAYVLGLTLPAVVAALARARAKLQVATRAALAAAWRTRAWPSAPRVELTAAERAIALRLLEGWSNARIARSRGVSERTVANQIASLFKKTGATSRSDLAGRFSATELLRS